ncbi:ImmA/IrrE family metallo-endopeptidase [Companilactobacillus metriopterae]|uniref:ImmA/IrrE family metallo-endopeptidase n=1 Tax=Companilactobacillus metriopterae TaxID=1909267 RepID=UPI00100B88C8|nr:ImmA/IrrE family metallo-endopeptidase [Companilactobacillus metriopterae]
MVTFEDIYSKEFIDLFGQKKEEIKQIEVLEEPPYINLDKISDILQINVNYTNENINEYDDDGKYDDEIKEITLKQNKPSTRKHFTYAHELGHAVLGHSGISLRANASKSDIDILRRNKETVANQFAAKLIMPKKLLLDEIEKTIKESNLNENELTEGDFEFIVKKLAESFNVSVEAMRYRILNLGLFVK